MTKLNLLGISDAELVEFLKDEQTTFNSGSNARPYTQDVWVKYSEFGFNFLRKHYRSIDDSDRRDISYIAVEKFISAAIRGKYNPVKSLSSTYYISICKNLANTHLHKEKGLPIVSDVIPDIMSSNSEEEILKKEITEKAEEIMDDFLVNKFKKKDCRDVILYKYRDKLSHNEISELMGYKSEKYSKNKLTRCMRYLREELVKTKDKFIIQYRKLKNL